MFTPKGKFGWYELMTSDTKAAGKFYSDVVGWTTKEMSSGEGQQYTTFNLGDRMNSLPVQIYTDVGSPNDQLVQRAWGAALALVALILITTFVARVFSRRSRLS